tara:strand:+ start:2257 stop:2949 length:693 start_codon:yes stop_codon:yes gene_type:complete
MSISTATKIGEDLRDIQYTGEVFITGFGEPLLHSQLHKLCKAITNNNCSFKCVTVVTNGDMLTRDTVKDLRDNGVTNIIVSMYDGPDQIDALKEVIDDILPYTLRERYHSSNQDYGIENMNNRSGYVKTRQIKEQYNDVCYLPFNKCQVDWNGDILLCDQDWGRNGVIGNIHDSCISDIWISDEMKRYRTNLIASDRSLSPCNKCDVNGKVYGKEQFDILRRCYESDSSR